MLEHPKIMVYYHSFYIIDRASCIKPELFYIYREAFTSLLKHSNSYHRDFGLTLLVNLLNGASEEEIQKFSVSLPMYLKCLYDEKFMTAECCVRNITRLLEMTNVYDGVILKALIEIELYSNYPDKQKALMDGYIINAMEVLYDRVDCKEEILGFVTTRTESISPKTRKVVKKFLSTYSG